MLNPSRLRLDHLSSRVVELVEQIFDRLWIVDRPDRGYRRHGPGTGQQRPCGWRSSTWCAPARAGAIYWSGLGPRPGWSCACWATRSAGSTAARPGFFVGAFGPYCWRLALGEGLAALRGQAGVGVCVDGGGVHHGRVRLAHPAIFVFGLDSAPTPPRWRSTRCGPARSLSGCWPPRPLAPGPRPTCSACSGSPWGWPAARSACSVWSSRWCCRCCSASRWPGS